MGFGHRVYKNYDPRAKIIKKATYEVFEVTGTNPLLDIAIELEKIALEDDYFIERKLYPNVDFYSGIIYEALGMPVEMFPVLFAIGRTSGWIAQWLEMIDDPEQKIARPRQIYTGERGPRLRPDRRAFLEPIGALAADRSARARGSTRTGSTSSTPALDALERRGRELAKTAPRETIDAKIREFEPVQQVVARLELVRTRALLPSDARRRRRARRRLDRGVTSAACAAR